LQSKAEQLIFCAHPRRCFLLLLLCMFVGVRVCVCTCVHVFIRCCFSVTLSNAPYSTALYCNTLQHNAPKCNTLQHTVTNCSPMQYSCVRVGYYCLQSLLQQCVAVHYCSVLQHLLQHTATMHCNAPQHRATNCNTHARESNTTVCRAYCNICCNTLQ